MEFLASRLAAIPGVVAVTLGGSRATNTAVEGSDWDFGLYYRGQLDPVDVQAQGWPGHVFAPGEWGRVVNGGVPADAAADRARLVVSARGGRVAIRRGLCRPRRQGRLPCEFVPGRAGRSAISAGCCRGMGSQREALVQRAGLGGVQQRLGQDQADLPRLVSDVRALLGVRDSVWIDPAGDQ